MDITIKRNRLEFFALAILLFPLINSLSKADWLNVRGVDALNIVLTFVIVILIIRLFLNPIWIKIEHGEVRIVKSFWGHEKFSLTDIVSVEEAKGYSFKILIQLSDGKVIKINSIDLKKEKKELLMRALDLRHEQY